MRGTHNAISTQKAIDITAELKPTASSGQQHLAIVKRPSFKVRWFLPIPIKPWHLPDPENRCIRPGIGQHSHPAYIYHITLLVPSTIENTDLTLYSQAVTQLIVPFRGGPFVLCFSMPQQKCYPPPKKKKKSVSHPKERKQNKVLLGVKPSTTPTHPSCKATVSRQFIDN